MKQNFKKYTDISFVPIFFSFLQHVKTKGNVKLMDIFIENIKNKSDN